jgi:hypothetical protein
MRRVILIQPPKSAEGFSSFSSAMLKDAGDYASSGQNVRRGVFSAAIQGNLATPIVLLM